MQYEDHRPRVAALRRERMRLRLFEGALALAAKQGVASTSIDDVITEAEVSRGTFYKYFDSSAALVEAVAREVANEVMILIDPIVLVHDDPVVRVATGVRLALFLARQNPVVGAFVVGLGWPNIPPDQLMLVFLPRDLLLGMQQEKFMQMEMSAAVNLTLGAVIGGIHTILSGGAPAHFPAQVAMTVLMGLGVDRTTAQRVTQAEISPLHIDGDGLLARTLDNARLDKADAKVLSPATRH